MSKLIGFITIFGFGVYTFYLSITDGLGFYIHPRYYEFSQFGTVVCIFVGSLGIINTLQHSNVKTLMSDAVRVSTWVPFIILIGVLTIGFVIPPEALSSRAASNRSSGSAVVSAGEEDSSIFSAFEKTDTSLTIADWVGEIARNSNLESYIGRQVDVTGFVYRDDNVSTNEFLVGRFVIRCCVVDATPIGLIVSTENASEYEDNEWVRIQGELFVETVENLEVLRLRPVEIEIVDEPASPYLY